MERLQRAVPLGTRGSLETLRPPPLPSALAHAEYPAENAWYGAVSSPIQFLIKLSTTGLLSLSADMDVLKRVME